MADTGRAAGSDIRAASLPPTSGMNASVDRFYAAIAAHGVRLVGGFHPFPEWVRLHWREVDALHIHWPELLWRTRSGERFAGLRGLAGFLEFLRAVRRRRLALLWTLHNTEPHEGATWADRVGYHILAQSADLIICLSRSARRELRRRFHPRGRTVLMYHGNYDGAYPPPAPRSATMADFGLDPRRPMVATLGRMRGYKGLDVAVEAAIALNGAVQLLIAGAGRRDYELAPLRRRIEGSASGGWIRLVDRALSPQEFSNVLAASEAMVMSYRAITNSAAFYAAMTFGRGVIASDLPFFREMLRRSPEAGRLFRPGDAGDLARALREYLAVPPERRARAARAIADAYPWEKVIPPVAAAVRDVVRCVSH